MLTRTFRSGALPLFLFLSLTGCSGSDEAGTGESEGAGKEDPKEEPTDSAEWETLVEADWSLPPGEEGYVCARVTVKETLYVQGFEAINPLGTHHTFVTVGEPNGKPDGVAPCSAAENFMRNIFGSGVGTEPLAFPEGVAARIEAGQQVLLNLHLFNTGDEELRGRSGTRIRRVAEADVEHFSEQILAGTMALNIPPGETTEHVGYCTMQTDVTLFGVVAHMHQLGIHERVFIEKQDESIKLWDAPYSFDDQVYDMMDAPLQLAKGDRVRVECTHRNTTPDPVAFGDSSTQEMCFAGLFLYPADSRVFICVQ